MRKPEVVTRLIFVKKLMTSGFSYLDACKAYETVMSTISDGIVGGARIYLGNVGSLCPSTMPPRHVVMGFIKGKGGKVTKQTREYWLDSRLKYRFNLFKAFMKTHQFRWFQ